MSASRSPIPEVAQSIGGVSLGCCVEPSSAIWMIIIMMALTLFLIIFFCVMGVTCRWIYKRRMRKKCEALRNKYIQDENQKRSDEMKAKRLALRPILPYHSRNENKDVLSKAAAFQRPSFQQGYQMQPMVFPMQSMFAQMPPMVAQTPPRVATQSTAPPPPAALVVPSAPAKVERDENNKNMKRGEPKKKEKRTKMAVEKKKVQQRRREVEVESSETKKTTESTETKKTELTDTKKTTTETKKTTEESTETTETTPWKDRKKQLNDPTGTTPTKGVSAWSSSTLASRKIGDNPVGRPSTTSSIPAGSLRPPNVYELKTGRKMTADEDVPSPSRGPVESSGRVPKGFSHLRAATIKRDCMPSLSDPTMPRRI